MGGRDRAFPLDSDAPVSGPGSSSSVAKRWWTHRNRGSEGDQLADKEIQWREAIFFLFLHKKKRANSAMESHSGDAANFEPRERGEVCSQSHSKRSLRGNTCKAAH